MWPLWMLPSWSSTRATLRAALSATAKKLPSAEQLSRLLACALVYSNRGASHLTRRLSDSYCGFRSLLLYLCKLHPRGRKGHDRFQQRRRPRQVVGEIQRKGSVFQLRAILKHTNLD